jgi:hypothetical protein
MNTGEFSVCQFFTNDSYEYVRKFVSAEEAVKAAHFYTHNVAASMGIVERVIITDGGDSCVFEWKKGEGIVWPENLKGLEVKSDTKIVEDQRHVTEGGTQEAVGERTEDRGETKT